MPKKKTHVDYIAEVKKINPNIEVLGIYTHSKIKILHKCKKDNCEWYATPNNILRGTGCPLCAGHKKKTHEEYVAKLAKTNPNIEVLGTYINYTTKIKHKCKIDGYEWFSCPKYVLRSTGCPRCWNHEIYGHEEYIKKVNIINQNIEVVGKYINTKTKIKHKCKIDGYEWYATPNDILQGRGCPKCNLSHGEHFISKYLTQMNIDYIPQYKFNDCKNKNPLRFDFYLPKLNVCIEYDGIQHFKPIDFAGKGKEWAFKRFKQNQRNDSIKNKYCKNNEITLLRIRYDQDIKIVLNNFFNHTYNKTS